MAGKFSKYSSNDENKPTRYYSRKQEVTVAKAIGGRTTSNSGASTYEKGDISIDPSVTSSGNSFLIECKTKTTHSDSISIKKEWFEKNKNEMIYDGKDHQALVFSFGPGEENYYIIEEYLFKELLEYLKNKPED